VGKGPDDRRPAKVDRTVGLARVDITTQNAALRAKAHRKKKQLIVAGSSNKNTTAEVHNKENIRRVYTGRNKKGRFGSRSVARLGIFRADGEPGWTGPGGSSHISFTDMRGTGFSRGSLRTATIFFCHH